MMSDACDFPIVFHQDTLSQYHQGTIKYSEHQMNKIWSLKRQRHLPPLIIKEVWLLSLNDDHIKQVPPVFSNNIPHPFVPGTTWQPG